MTVDAVVGVGIERLFLHAVIVGGGVGRRKPLAPRCRAGQGPSMSTRKPPLAGEALRATLGDLLRQRGVAVNEPAAPSAAAPAPAVRDGFDFTSARALVVRRERKGHGGKTVTVVDGLALSPAAAEALARAMRKALGCGSWVDAGRVVLQGDRAAAAAAWLARHGARQVTRGN